MRGSLGAMRHTTRLLSLAAALALIALAAPTASAGLLPAPSLLEDVVPTEAVPLAGPVPDWYTPELHAEVVAAGPAGVQLPDAVSVPQSALAFTGIRPGSWMISPAMCTMNFVFGSGTDLYIGTAGHCTEVGDTVTLLVLPNLLVDIGTTVKSVNNDIGDDFALVRIDPALAGQVNPSMAIVGGPTASAPAPIGTPVLHVGHGLAVGTGGTPRAGLVTYSGTGDNPGSDAIGWDGLGTPGDSGSPVRSLNGEAVGNFTHIVVGGKYVPAVLAGTSIDRILEIAAKPLATAPLLPDPL